MAALVDDPSTWADDFIVPEVQTMWRGAITGEVTSGEEAILQRVIWRAVFSSYLGELNGEPVRHPAPIEVSGVGRRPVATPAPPQPGLRERLRRIPVVRRAARSRLGRRLRGLT
jgi:hypothetical protein